MGPAETCAHVSSGREVVDVCPDCGAERVAIDMFALDTSGPMLLGRVTYCADCGTRWHCAFCLHLEPMTENGHDDGRRIYRHVRTHEHAA